MTTNLNYYKAYIIAYIFLALLPVVVAGSGGAVTRGWGVVAGATESIS